MNREESSTSYKRPPATNPVVDFFSKNALSLIQSFILLIVLFTGVRNDVSNVTAQLKNLTVQMEKMQETVIRLEGFQSKVGFLEQRQGEFGTMIANQNDKFDAYKSICESNLARLDAKVEGLERDVARLESRK